MKKKIAISLLLIALMVGVAYGAAAALNVQGGVVQGGVIQAGKDTTLECQSSNDVIVGWRTCAGGGGDARIFGLELSGFDTACNDCEVLAYLLTNTGNFPTSGSGMWRSSAGISGGNATVDQYWDGSWNTATCGQGPLAEDIYQVHLIVKNAFASTDG